MYPVIGTRTIGYKVYITLCTPFNVAFHSLVVVVSSVRTYVLSFIMGFVIIQYIEITVVWYTINSDVRSVYTTTTTTTTPVSCICLCQWLYHWFLFGMSISVRIVNGELKRTSCYLVFVTVWSCSCRRQQHCFKYHIPWSIILSFFM